MSSPQLEWLSIKDFSPGIYDVVTPNNPLGAATVENTYQCLVAENGALIPGPRRNTEALIDEDPGSSPDSPYFIGGLFVADPIFDGTTPVGENQNNSEIFVGYEWFEGDDRRRMVRRYKRHALTPSWETLIDDTVSVPGLYDADYRPARCCFQSSRSNSGATTDAGLPVVIICYDGILEGFPDDTAPGVTGTVSLPKPGSSFPQPNIVITHQNRVVIFPLTLNGFGTGEVYATNEGIYWTAVNDYLTNAAADFSNVIFGAENPTGYQTGASLSANELLLIKSKGGAIMLRGDLDNVTSVNLPYVKGCGFSINWGVATKIGFAYCVDNGGMYVWNGGDTAEDISLQLGRNFWRPLDQIVDNYYRTPTTCCRYGEYIVTPNNWLYDMDRGGWWRLDDPSQRQYYHLDSDWTGRWLYGSRHLWEDGDTAEVAHEFDNALGEITYSWQSHPLPNTMDREVEAREIIAVISGEGNITVTVTAEEGDTDSGYFEVINPFPKTFRAPIRVKGTNLQVRIEAEAFDATGSPGADGAPTVHEVRLGIDKRNRIERPAV